MKHTTLIAGLLIVLAGCGGTLATVDDVIIEGTPPGVTPRTITLSNSESHKDGAQAMSCSVLNNGQVLLKVSSDIKGLGCSAASDSGGDYVQVTGTNDWPYRIRFDRNGRMRVSHTR